VNRDDDDSRGKAPGISVLSAALRAARPGTARRTEVGKDQKRNSPARTPATKAFHSSVVKDSGAASGFFESLIRYASSSLATSTQVALPQRELFFHFGAVISSISKPFQVLPGSPPIGAPRVNGGATLGDRF
jgi:hypothetical protein